MPNLFIVNVLTQQAALDEPELDHRDEYALMIQSWSSNEYFKVYDPLKNIFREDK